MSRRLITISIAVIVALCIGAVPALAQTSQQGYSSPAGNIQAQVSSGGNANNASGVGGAPSRTVSTSGSQLPFTGLDVGLIFGTGFVLLLTGVALSRLTRAGTSRTD